MIAEYTAGTLYFACPFCYTLAAYQTPLPECNGEVFALPDFEVNDLCME